MSADTQKYEITDDVYYDVLNKHYKHLIELEKPSKIEVEKNIQYNFENGIEAGEQKTRGTNKIPKKKKRKK